MEIVKSNKNVVLVLTSNSATILYKRKILRFKFKGQNINVLADAEKYPYFNDAYEAYKSELTNIVKNKWANENTQMYNHVVVRILVATFSEFKAQWIFSKMFENET